MQSKAKSVSEYLAALPEDRRTALESLRKLFRENLDPKIEEGMQYGMIGYYIPHRVFPAGYHCDPTQPLCFAGMASQKNHMSLYIMCLYAETPLLTRFRDECKVAGKKLDMGKACIRFKKIDDLALDAIARVIKQTTAAGYIDFYEKAMAGRAKTRSARKAVKPKPRRAVQKLKTRSHKQPTASSARSSGQRN